MASAFSHAIVAAAIGSVVQAKKVGWWYWALGVFLAVVPDLDVIGFRFGVRYGDVLGHRGFSHSLVFALVAAALCSWAFEEQRKVFLFFFLATASHGVLDAMTNGGLGVAFFSPFSNTRFFFPFHPIEVSPIGIDRFFSAKGITVIQSEIKWLWVPSVVIFVVATAFRRRLRSER